MTKSESKSLASGNSLPSLWWYFSYRHVIDKDVTLIRIQRDLREKTSQVDALRSQLLVSESTCVELKERNSELMKDLQELNRRFDEVLMHKMK